VETKGEATLEIEAERDVRAELCAALVQRGLGILELRRGERELESVFLRLAADDEQRGGRPARKKKKRAEAGGEAAQQPAKGEGEAT
jgi:ABC-2 type transport system ATP-binding protein